MKTIKKYRATVVGLLIATSGILQAQEYTAESGEYRLEPVAEGLEVPWGMVWLEDGSMLVTERSGTLLHIINGEKHTITGLPEIYASGQGGLMDIELPPDYEETGWIYFTYSFREGSEGGNTALMRAKLENGALKDSQLLYKATPNATTRHHYGGRIEFDNNGHLFLSLGERGEPSNAQDTKITAGSILRLNMDGTIPEDNPFVDTKGYDPAIWSYGHRNVQGLAFHPESGNLYNTEHGPQGGDELNLVGKGNNYGWPVITYGINYDGTEITSLREKEGMQQPVKYWVPSIAPSSLMFVSGNQYPEWTGDALIGSLKFNYLERVDMEGNEVRGTEKLLEDIGRIRDVRQGPDGYIYVAVEGKGIYKLILEK